MRQYLIGSWANADEYDYSGEQLMGNRLGASRDASHFNKDGSANVAKYGDNTEQTKKKTSIPLKQRILPQAARVEKLTAQMVELVQEYKQGLHTQEEYSLLLSVIAAKRARAEELLTKAVSVKAPFEQEESVEAQDDAQHSPQVNSPIHAEKPVQISVFGACKSAKADVIYYTSAVVGVFTAFMWFTN